MPNCFGSVKIGSVSLDISQRSVEGVMIFKLSGRLTVGVADTIRDRVIEELEKGQTRFVMDLADLSYIDSTGLGSLVMCYTTAQKSNGTVKLLNLNKRNIELLYLTKLHTIFETFSDEQDAVNSFFPDRKIQRFDILNFVQEHEKDQ